MELFHRYKLIFFTCIIIFIFQTGCNNDTPTNITVTDQMQEIKNTEMNLTQIQNGDYSSLLGTWKQIAYADNLFDGRGMQWHMGKTDTVSSILSVSMDKIDYNNSTVIIQGNTLTDSENSYELKFYNDGTYLSADLADRFTAINWAVSFYPKGAANGYEPNNGVQIDNTKNLIIIWYSGMQVLTVFGQD